MSANNNNWICFDCRYAIRKPKMFESTPKCNVCGKDCFCLGYKIAVPKKTDRKAWEELRQNCRRKLLNNFEADIKSKVKLRHAIEKEIAHLESRGFNRERNRQINHLKGLLKNFS